MLCSRPRFQGPSSGGTKEDALSSTTRCVSVHRAEVSFNSQIEQLRQTELSLLYRRGN